VTSHLKQEVAQMNIFDLFTKNYFTANELGGKALTTTIKAFRLEALNGKIQNAVVDLDGQNRPLLLNRTLAHGIAALHSAETDNWVGKTITLYPEEKKWGGDIIQTIRIQTPVAGEEQTKPPGQAVRPAATKQGKRI
jgi:hypothetical protein